MLLPTELLGPNLRASGVDLDLRKTNRTAVMKSMNSMFPSEPKEIVMIVTLSVLRRSGRVY